VPSFDFEKAGNKGKMPILMITAVAGGVVLIAACAVAAWFLLARPAALKPANGEPQSLPPRQQKNAPNQEANRTSSDIRHVDFRNFTYATSISDRKCYGLPATIQVRNGEFKAGQGDQEAYFSVGGIRYGDLTGDGREEAVVNTGCGMSTGNAWTDDFYAYAVRNGQVENLGSFGSDEMERDYLRYYPNGGLWRVDSFKVTSGKLIIECYADGSHAAPQYMATLEYRWNGQAFVLNGSPQKRRLPLPAAESPVSRGPKKGDFVAWDKLDEKPKRLSDLSVVYPPEAAQNQVRGTADLEINIDETGRVTSVNILSGPVPDYGLNDACVKAAKAVSYMPAVKAGVPVKTRQEYLIALTPPPPPVAPKPVTPAASSLGVIIEAKANLGRFQLLVDQQVVWDSSLMGHLGEIKRATKEFQVPPGTHKLDFQAWMPNATQPVSSASWGYTAAQGERHILKFYVTIFGNTKWQIVQ
jgi:TonB family protein